MRQKKFYCLEILSLSVYLCYLKRLFNKISDKSIIEGIRLQDVKVLNYVYDNYFQTIKNHVKRNSGTDDDVSDVFQDTIIALYKQISDNNLTLTSDLKGYFFGIAKNIWNVQLRYKKRVTELDIDIEDETDADEFNDPLLERVMSRAFQKLMIDCQTVLTLFSDGCSYEEIAIKMNHKNETYARRKKYLCKEALIELIKKDSEYREYQRFLK
jgi:RNA polymerase sigma factor (sigma-70 family)